jgi:hypothetical protein
MGEELEIGEFWLMVRVFGFETGTLDVLVMRFGGSQLFLTCGIDGVFS